MERYHYSDEARTALERLQQPFAVYQVADGKISTLLVSDGFCRLLGYEKREQAVYDMDHNMYKDTHPDDKERIIEAALETLSALVVSLKAEPGALSMRVLVSAASFTLPPESISASGEGRPQDVSVTKEGQDLIFHCIFRKGGEP